MAALWNHFYVNLQCSAALPVLWSMEPPFQRFRTFSAFLGGKVGKLKFEPWMIDDWMIDPVSKNWAPAPAKPCQTNQQQRMVTAMTAAVAVAMRADLCTSKLDPKSTNKNLLSNCPTYNSWLQTNEVAFK